MSYFLIAFTGPVASIIDALGKLLEKRGEQLTWREVDAEEAKKLMKHLTAKQQKELGL